MKEATPTNYTWSLAKELATCSTQGHLPGVRSFLMARVGIKCCFSIATARTRGVAQHDVMRARCALVIIVRAREPIQEVQNHRDQALARSALLVNKLLLLLMLLLLLLLLLFQLCQV